MILKSRLISKQDYDLEHKELEKVIPRSSRDKVLILDDNQEVWHLYRDNLIQVVPYYFWKNEEDKESVSFTSNKDYYLHYLWSFLDRAINILKKFKLENPLKPQLKIQVVVKELHDHLLIGKRIHFTGVFPTDINLEDTKEYKRVKARRGSVCPDLENSNLLLAGTFKGTQY